jgi:DNA-binding IclR family transcriptional regulator
VNDVLYPSIRFVKRPRTTQGHDLGPASLAAQAQDGDRDADRVPAVTRAFQLLSNLASDGPTSLADIVSDTSLNKSTAYYTLRALQSLGAVTYDPTSRRYSLGPRLVELGIAAGDQVDDLATARAELGAMAGRLEATLVLYRRLGTEVLILERFERPHGVRISLDAGVRLPIQGGSFGRAFLAFDEPSRLDEVLRAGLVEFTPKSITNVTAFRRELELVRKRGWAVDHEGFALGVSTVAAPIFEADGSVTLVAAAVGFTPDFTRSAVEELGHELRAACDRIGTPSPRRHA